MNRNLFDYIYILPSEPTERSLAENMKVFGAMLGSFVVTAIVAGLIVAGLLRLTRRSNLTDKEHQKRADFGIMSVFLVSFVAVVATPIWLYWDEADPQPPTPKETYSGIFHALHNRGSTDFQFRLGNEVDPYTPLESLDYFIIRDSSRFNCRADVVGIEHTPESGNKHSMVTLRLVKEDCDTGFNINRWESVVREHGHIKSAVLPN